MNIFKEYKLLDVEILKHEIINCNIFMFIWVFLFSTSLFAFIIGGKLLFLGFCIFDAYAWSYFYSKKKEYIKLITDTLVDMIEKEQITTREAVEML